ncbi:MAG: ATP synthase F1 subunit epsilon [Lentimicrobiaceae bacterium]|jgi:F-type H+-transporting ATPase subunit epsilon|nr:ATP synthase F1 subunit epsilon [Lentimicrobiaceae bacterium]
MKLEIIKPDQTLYTGEVSLVQLTGIDGSLEILNHHAPLISILVKGKIKIVDNENQTFFYEVNGGVVEVKNNTVLILAE